jgi:hypothetical protein
MQAIDGEVGDAVVNNDDEQLHGSAGLRMGLRLAVMLVSWKCQRRLTARPDPSRGTITPSIDATFIMQRNI